jgi:hypothetical protein
MRVPSMAPSWRRGPRPGLDQLDAAGLAAAAGVDLRLDHPASRRGLRCRRSSACSPGQAAASPAAWQPADHHHRRAGLHVLPAPGAGLRRARDPGRARLAGIRRGARRRSASPTRRARRAVRRPFDGARLAAAPLARRSTRARRWRASAASTSRTSASSTSTSCRTCARASWCSTARTSIRLMNEAAAKYLGIGPGWRGRADRARPRRGSTRRCAWRERRASPELAAAVPSADGSTADRAYLRAHRPAQERRAADVPRRHQPADRKGPAGQARGARAALRQHRARNPQPGRRAQPRGPAARRIAENLDESDQQRLTDHHREQRHARQQHRRERAAAVAPRAAQPRAHRPGRLGQAVRGGVRRLSRSCRESAVDLEISGAPIEVRMDPGHLHQVVTNLCENALRYACRPRASRRASSSPSAGAAAPTGRTSRCATAAPASRRSWPSGCSSRSSAPPATPNSATAAASGCSSRASCAKCNRAALIYEPRDGGGSAFVLSSPTRSAGRPEWRRPTVLIVDDEPDIRELLSMTLEGMDIEPDTAADLAEARQQAADQRLPLLPHRHAPARRRRPRAGAVDAAPRARRAGGGDHRARQRRDRGARAQARRLRLRLQAGAGQGPAQAGHHALKLRAASPCPAAPGSAQPCSGLSPAMAACAR